MIKLFQKLAGCGAEPCEYNTTASHQMLYYIIYNGTRCTWYKQVGSNPPIAGSRRKDYLDYQFARFNINSDKDMKYRINIYGIVR